MQVQGMIVPKKGSMVAESSYILDSTAHAQPAGAQSSPAFEDGDAQAPTFDRYHDHFIWEATSSESSHNYLNHITPT